MTTRILVGVAGAAVILTLPVSAPARLDAAKTLCADPGTYTVDSGTATSSGTSSSDVVAPTGAYRRLSSIGPTTGGCGSYDWDVSPDYTGDYYTDTTSANAAEPPPPSPVTPALPTWRNLYDWPNGHGYVGWHTSSSSQMGAYGLQSNLGGNYGLWLWPVGGSSYSYSQGQFAEWNYTAPGTTRLSNAALVFSYKNKLLAHHCIDVGFRDANGVIVTHNEHCVPVQPPDSQRQVNISLVDPSTTPTSKVLYFRIRVDCGGASTCSKNIPQLDPLFTGGYARMTRVDMILTDPEDPGVEGGGELRALEGKYINGRSTYGLTLGSDDPGSGVQRLWLDAAPGGTLTSQNAPCDPTHHTDILDNRICPEYFSYDTTVDSNALPEGAVTFTPKATDLAARQGTGVAWTIYVDRTAPSAASGIAETDFDGGSATASLAWTPGVDPNLPDGNPGSGAADAEIRYSVNGGSWSDWADADQAAADISPVALGDQLQIEVRQFDDVGNAGPVTSAALTVFAATGQPSWYSDTSPDPTAIVPLTSDQRSRAISLAESDAQVQSILGAGTPVVDDVVAVQSDDASGVTGARLTLSSATAQVSVEVDFGSGSVVGITQLDGDTRSLARTGRNRIIGSTQTRAAVAKANAALESSGFVKGKTLRRLTKKLVPILDNDVIWNWDFHTTHVDLNSPQAKTKVDWPVSLIFYGDVDVKTAGDIWNRGVQSASRQWGRMKDGFDFGQDPHATTKPQWDSSEGTWTGAICAKKYHYRIYAPGPDTKDATGRVGLDRMYNLDLHYYVIATTHIDIHEICSKVIGIVSGGLIEIGYTGDSEVTEQKVAAAAPRHKHSRRVGPCPSPIVDEDSDPWSVRTPSGADGHNALNLYNRDERGQIKSAKVIMNNDGKATMIYVPDISHPPKKCFGFIP